MLAFTKGCGPGAPAWSRLLSPATRCSSPSRGVNGSVWFRNLRQLFQEPGSDTISFATITVSRQTSLRCTYRETTRCTGRSNRKPLDHGKSQLGGGCGREVGLAETDRSVSKRILCATLHKVSFATQVLQRQQAPPAKLFPVKSMSTRNQCGPHPRLAFIGQLDYGSPLQTPK